MIPNLSGRVDPITEATIRELRMQLDAQGRATTTAIAGLPKPLSIQDIAGALGPGGKNSLNVTGLVGLLAQPQNAKVTNVTTAPTSGPLAQNGTLFTINGQLFYYLNGQSIPVSSLAIVLYDTHANRLANYPAGNYVAGTLFFETDREVLYIDNGTNWIYGVGIDYDTLAHRPGDLGINDVGFLFVASDYNSTVTYRWSGSTWLYFQGVYAAATGSRPTLISTDVGFLFIDTALKLLEYWTGTVWLNLGSSTTFTPSFRAFSGTSDTLLNTDFTVESTNSGTSTETLLDATTCTNQVFCLKNSVTSTNTLTITPFGGQTIDGGTLILNPQESVIIQSNGINWIILSYYKLILSGIAFQGAGNGVQLTLTTSYQNVAGASLTLNRTGLWKITAILDVQTGATPGAAIGQLLIAGSPVTPLMAPINTGATTLAVGVQTWLYTSGSSSVACQLQAKIFTGTVFVNNGAGYSSLTAEWIHP
jgi:hypothetical protein